MTSFSCTRSALPASLTSFSVVVGMVTRVVPAVFVKVDEAGGC